MQTRLRSTVVKRFVRFAPAAFCAVAATQITYIICLGPAGLTAGVAGFAGWLAGAAVSYVISRWAWERKGRPHLLKETLPFVAVSIGAGIILTLASKFGNHVAMEMGLNGAARVLVADVFYFAANCLTFALRFVIFHLILFADRNAKVGTRSRSSRAGRRSQTSRWSPCSPPSPPGPSHPPTPPPAWLPTHPAGPAPYAGAVTPGPVNRHAGLGQQLRRVTRPPRGGRRAGDAGARHPAFTREHPALITREHPGPVVIHRPRVLFVADPGCDRDPQLRVSCAGRIRGRARGPGLPGPGRRRTAPRCRAGTGGRPGVRCRRSHHPVPTTTRANLRP